MDLLLKFALKGNFKAFREKIDDIINQTYRQKSEDYQFFIIMKALLLGYEHYLECIEDVKDERVAKLKEFLTYIAKHDRNYLTPWFEPFEGYARDILERLYHAFKDGEWKIYEHYENLPFQVYAYLEMQSLIDELFEFVGDEESLMLWYALMIYNVFKLPWVNFAKGERAFFTGNAPTNYHKYKLNLIMHFCLTTELYYRADEEHILNDAYNFFEGKLPKTALLKYIRIILNRVNYWKNLSYKRLQIDERAITDFPFWKQGIFFTNLKALYIMKSYRHLPKLAQVRLSRIFSL